MILTVLFGAVLGILAFGLTRPVDLRRLAGAAVGGAVLGFIAAYFNVYPGSIRAVLTLIAVALFVSGTRFAAQLGERTYGTSEPLVPRLPLVGGLIVAVLVLAALFPYTEAGAKSVDEPIYHDLNNHIVEGSAPALPSAAEVRVVPWDLASQLVVRGYGADASFLDTNPQLLMRHTYPDTVNGEFIWVHAPTPETAKWMFGGRVAEMVVYVKNNATDLEPRVLDGVLKVHPDGRFWQDRVQRYAETHGELRYTLQDMALQLDDDYHPYWVAYLSRIDLRSQPHLEKIVVIDAYSGEDALYSPADAPAWIEQVYPESYVYYWAQYWGAYREGIMYRWFDANKLVQPDDVTVRYIRLENQTFWLLPMRQLNAPQLGGYILVNTRSGDATFYSRYEDRLVDYETAYNQLQAIMASGEATGGQGQIRLAISEGYLYPIRMADNSTRDAYVFPLLEGLKVSNFAIIDAQEYQSRRVFAPTMERALAAFANRTTGGLGLPITPDRPDGTVNLTLDEGVLTDDGAALANFNGTWYRITAEDLQGGNRREAQREFDELRIAIARADRAEGGVPMRVLFETGRIVDITLPDVSWGT